MKNRPLIKVCGMRDINNIRDVYALNVDYLGFIFYPLSPRYVRKSPGYTALPEILSSLPCHKTGVFVDEQAPTIIRTARSFHLDSLQLHGHESPALCRHLQAEGFQVIKAFSIGEEKDLEATCHFEQCSDFFLFDTRCPTGGGSGKQFDWSILQRYTGETPFFLSGGIGPDSLKEVNNFRHSSWAGLDLNSRFESAIAYKNTGLLKQFINQLKTH